MDFEKGLGDLINRCSLENGSDTPDYILAQYLVNCLDAFNTTMRAREAWYGQGSAIEENDVKKSTEV